MSKDKRIYNKLNYIISPKGFTLKDAFKKNIFHLRENKIYFRGNPLYPVENTIFHLISDSGILLEKIPYISYNYFKKIIKDSSDIKKLILLKTLLQTMGWGIVTIIPKENEIIIDIKNPPYGFQVERDRWDFLINTIMGYIWLIDKDFRIGDILEGYKHLIVKYVC